MFIDLVGERIREGRKELGLTQQQVAGAAGVSRLTLSRLETGKLREVGYGKLLRLLHAVGLDFRVTTFNRGRPTFEDLLREAEG